MIELGEKSGRDPAGEVHRRAALRTMALGGVALFALTGLTGVAAALTGETLTQDGWRRCRKCQILFFALDRNGGLGVCPAGGTHQPSNDFYLLQMGREIAGVRQGGWSWCMNCMGLYARVHGNMGLCPAAAGSASREHVNFSGGYAVPLGDGGEDREASWRWCSKCMGMFYAGRGGGRCPDGHSHDGAASLAYAQLVDGPREP